MKTDIKTGTEEKVTYIVEHVLTKDIKIPDEYDENHIFVLEAGTILKRGRTLGKFERYEWGGKYGVTIDPKDVELVEYKKTVTTTFERI
jgi:hypothetical protein